MQGDAPYVLVDIDNPADVVIPKDTDVSKDGQEVGLYSWAIAFKSWKLFWKRIAHNILFVDGYSFNKVWLGPVRCISLSLRDGIDF